MSDQQETPQSAPYKRFLEDLAVVLKNSQEGTWLSSSDSQEVIDACFKHLALILEQDGRIGVARVGRDLVVNEAPAGVEGPFVAALVEVMSRAGADNFSLERGLALDTFREFVEVFKVSRDDLDRLGGFTEALTRIGLEHVDSRKVVFKQVSEDEVVVDKRAAELAGKLDLDDEQRRAVVAFLQGSRDASGPGTAGPGLQAAADGDTDSLVAMIMEAACAVPESEETREAATVVRCLRRAYEGLCNHPSAKTQKGKKRLARILTSVQDAILKGLEGTGGDLSADEQAAIREAVEEMTDELKLDSLTASYMRQRKAVQKNEERILRLIRQKGPEGIEDSELWTRLTAAGLTRGQWRSLVARSGVAPGTSLQTDVTLAGVTELESLAQRLQKGSQDSSATATELTPILEQVHTEMEHLAARTEQRIAGLLSDLESELLADDSRPSRGAGKKKTGMSRARLLELLAEIVQELCQPLSVVQCSLNMITSRHLGEVPGSQADMLNLALESTRKLSGLVEKLKGISGMPEGLSPDEQIQKSLYA